MRRRIEMLAISAALALALTHVACADTVSGTWKISVKDASTVQFELRSVSDDGTRDSEDGRSVTLASLGLSQAQLTGPNGPVTFTLAHEAGDIVCRGTLGGGWGAGTFSFTPRAAYASAMRSRGSAIRGDREQMAGAMLDITIAYVDGLAKVGFDQIPFKDLIGMRALDVTPEYIADMKSAGVGFLYARETVEARALDVTPAFVREMAGVGYPNLPVRQLVQLRSLSIDAAYVRKVQAHGLGHLTIQKLVEAKAMNVI
ncbi:MAG TPA: hypothetical protein VIG46_10240 [Candidatus Baltobacteraceae bacterium]